MKNIYIFLFFCFILTACLDEPDCIQEASDEILFLFKNDSTGASQSVKFDSVVITGADSVLYRSKATPSTFIPLNPLTTETEIIFNSPLGHDTIVLQYNTVTRLISPNCGAETFFLDLSVKEHTFDSLKIINLIVLPDGEPNFEIYY
ncbi:MAG: DUF6452 family protein [Candidatus Cyclobacteriaceae bacterium M2_1C_046]